MNPTSLLRTSLPVAFALFVGGVASSCQAPQPNAVRREVAVVPRVPFPEQEYDRLPKTGKNTVTGQAFMKTRGGDVKTAAGEPVRLSPVTSYSTQFFDFSVRRKHESFQELSPPDARVLQYIKETTADATGRFSFYDVPAGEYYIYTLVRWEAPGRAGLELQGGLVGEKITVKDGERNEVILTEAR